VYELVWWKLIFEIILKLIIYISTYHLR